MLLAGKGLTGCKELLERAQLLLRADRDQDVADVEHRVRIRRGVEAAVRLPQRDDQRAGLVSHARVADRAAGLRTRARDLDLLEPKIGTPVPRDDVEEGRDLR